MKYIMRKHNVERIADTNESMERLKKLGYTVKETIGETASKVADEVVPDTVSADESATVEMEQKLDEEPVKSRRTSKASKETEK